MDCIKVQTFFEEQAKMLNEIVIFIKSQLPLETRASILSYFFCYYVTEYKNEYFKFISKIEYKKNEHFKIIENLELQWSKKMFSSTADTLSFLNNDYRYVFLYTPFKLCDFRPETYSLLQKIIYQEHEYKKYLKNWHWITKTNFYC